MSENTEPARLLGDPAVSGSLRADLALASATPPLVYSVEAGLARFQATLASGGAGASSSLGATKAVLAGVAALVVAGAVVLALVDAEAPGPAPATSAVALAVHDAPPPMPPPASAPVPGHAMPLAATVDGIDAVAGEPAAATAEAAAESAAAPRVSPAHADETAAPRNPAPAAPVAAAPAGSDVLREAKQVQQAKKALASDPAETLRLLQQIEREFPQGQLIEERQGLRVRALLATGEREQGERRAAHYLARHPRGTLAARVRRALAELP